MLCFSLRYSLGVLGPRGGESGGGGRRDHCCVYLFDTLWEYQLPGEGREEAGEEITVVLLFSILFGVLSPRGGKREGGQRDHCCVSLFDTLWKSQVPGEGKEKADKEITVVFLSLILFGSPRSQGRGGRMQAKRPHQSWLEKGRTHPGCWIRRQKIRRKICQNSKT